MSKVDSQDALVGVLFRIQYPFIVNATSLPFRPITTVPGWKDIIVKEQYQAVFACQLSALAYSNQFPLDEIRFGVDTAAIDSFVYGRSYFYFDEFGGPILDAPLFAENPAVINPLNQSSIPDRARLMLVCTFNSDLRSNEVLETLHSYCYDAYFLSRPGEFGNDTGLPRVEAFALRNYIVSIRGSASLQDFLIEYAPSSEFTLDLAQAIPFELRATHIFYANNAVKLFKSLVQQNTVIEHYSNPLYNITDVGLTIGQRENYPMLITGHSLGASVARCFLQLMMHTYPSSPLPSFMQTGSPATTVNVSQNINAPAFGFRGKGLNYDIYTFGCPPVQYLPFNYNVALGFLLLDYYPEVRQRHFVNHNDPVPNLDLPSLRFLDGLPRIRLYNETYGYYAILDADNNSFGNNNNSNSNNNNTVFARLQKVSQINYQPVPIFGLLSTDHPASAYIRNILGCDTDQFETEIANTPNQFDGVPYTINQAAVIFNVIARFANFNPFNILA